MEASKIEYQEKEIDKKSGKASEQTWRYQDANEVKEVVNQHADILDGAVQSVTGDGVNNTDPTNPVLTFPNTSEVSETTDKNYVTDSELVKISSSVNSTTTGEPTGSDVVLNTVSLTQAEYDAGTPIATTLYIITDA